MRRMSALFISTAILISSAQAADITQQGAQELESKFTAYLPDDMAKAGLIKVRPGTQDYEVTLDPTVLLKGADPNTVTISGLKPLLSLIRPLEDGLWRFVQTADLNVKGQFAKGPEKTDFAYKIDAMRTEGIVDPDLLYFKSAKMASGSIFLTTTSPTQTVEARFGSMNSTMNSKRATPTTVDIRSDASLSGFSETIIDPAKMHVDISADSITADVAFNGLAYRPLQDIVFFVLDKVKKQKLAPEEQARLKELARANMPMFETILESIDVNNLKIDTPQGMFGAQTLRYTVSSNGLRDNANFGFGISIEKPSIPSGIVPEALLAALPETINSNISFTNINLASGITYFLDNADFNADKALSDAQATEVGRIFLPGGALTMRYDDISARSAVYDFSITGSTTVYPEQKERQNTDLTVYARDFDRTISFFQDNAKTVPQFGQAAFVMLMVKGFAQTATDGRQMWNIVIDENKKIKINGQDLPFQQ